MNKEEILKIQVISLSNAPIFIVYFFLARFLKCVSRSVQTCVLKVNIHCDGCKQEVKKILQKIDGNFPLFQQPKKDEQIKKKGGTFFPLFFFEKEAFFDLLSCVWI